MDEREDDHAAATDVECHPSALEVGEGAEDGRSEDETYDTESEEIRGAILLLAHPVVVRHGRVKKFTGMGFSFVAF